MRELVRHFLAMLRSKRLFALHLVANAVLLFAANIWLLIPEERVWQLLLSAVSALLILFLFLWLHSSTLAYGINPANGSLRTTFRPRLRGVLWLLAGLTILVLLMRWVDGWTEWQSRLAFYIYSKTPSFLRPTAGGLVMYRWVGRAIDVTFWYLVPSLLLPSITARVVGNRSLSNLRALLCWRYWLAMAIVTLVGVGASQLLLGWIPGHTLRAQSVSIAIRLAIAYFLATAAWLMTCGILGYFVGPPTPIAGESLMQRSRRR